VVLVLRVLKHVRRLAELNAEAAAGLANNMGAAPQVGAVAEVAGNLGQAAAALASEAEALERSVESLSPVSDARGP
jgi:hypothetical protein